MARDIVQISPVFVCGIGQVLETLVAVSLSGKLLPYSGIVWQIEKDRIRFH